MPTPSQTSDRGEPQKNLLAQKIAENRNPTGKVLINSNLLFKLRYFKKTLSFDLPPLIVGSVTQHTSTNVTMLPHKLKLIEFSSLQKVLGQ